MFAAAMAALRHEDLMGYRIPADGEHLYKTGVDGGPSVGTVL
ncbi:hypothetical protein L828_1503 [Mycobacteroides abscessus MAB_030201_1061]|nr:hypothetical protein L828_1503 [Mycobacteroides abscessus MAB_030201_1061]